MPVTISNHRVVGAATPTTAPNGKPINFGTAIASPRYVVMHYTGGATLDEALNALGTNRTSYHVIIEPDGALHQTAPFNRRAFHAGQSNWHGQDDLNDFTIGVSLVSVGGWLSRMANGAWRSPGGFELPASEVLAARHHISGVASGWARYPDPQIAAALDVVRALVATYPTLVDTMGHDEVAMGRRDDPGPALDWAPFHAMFPNRSGLLGANKRVVAGGAILRRSRNSSSAAVANLPAGARVQERSIGYVRDPAFPNDPRKFVKGVWRSVALQGQTAHAGFLRAQDLV